MTPDKHFPGAREGDRAVPRCKEGVQLPKGIPRDPHPQGSEGEQAGDRAMGDAAGGCTEELQSPAVTQVPSRGPSRLFLRMGIPQPTLAALTAGWVLQKQACHLESPKIIPKMPLPGSYQVVQEQFTPRCSPTAFLSCCNWRLAAPAPEIPP